MSFLEDQQDGEEQALRLKRLKFRSWHRGFKEADLILGNFADQHLASLNAEQLDRFEALLSAQDHDLYGWIIGREPVPQQHDHDVMELLQSFQYFAKTLWQSRADLTGS